MSQIERIEEMRLTPGDEQAIAALLGRAFDTDFGGRSYFKQRHHLRLVWREGGQVLGHMALCMRDIRLGDTLTPIIGLAEVATDPDHRGRGIATAVMAGAIEEASASIAEFFVLFGDQPLYAASGFVTKANPYVAVRMHGARTAQVDSRTAESLMVLPLRGGYWDGAATVDLLGPAF